MPLSLGVWDEETDWVIVSGWVALSVIACEHDAKYSCFPIVRHLETWFESADCVSLTLHDCVGVLLEVERCDILDVDVVVGVGIAEGVSVEVNVGVADGDGSSTVLMTLLSESA